MAETVVVLGSSAIVAYFAAAVVLSLLTYVTIVEISEYAKANVKEESGPYELHHAFPMFMGGLYKQELVPMGRKRHRQLHKNLAVFLDKYYPGMRPKRGNAGPQIQRSFSTEKRLEAMARFYLVNMDCYADAATQFFKDHIDLLNDENIKWAKEHAFESKFWQTIESWIREETPE
ncbi:hypothetical protein WKV44_10595 [Spirochaetia bacterium 38H-sp]|uniref:DUF4760 domain-containing protein n=1 Tax=Rarispira pelagica TaxID=3141764 RepID=A0ABU9UE89_9SPIR